MTDTVRRMLQRSLAAEGSHLHIVPPKLDPLQEQQIAALGILAQCAEAAAQLEDMASLDRLPPFVRARAQRMSVTIAAGVADLEDNISGKTVR